MEVTEGGVRSLKGIPEANIEEIVVKVIRPKLVLNQHLKMVISDESHECLAVVKVNPLDPIAVNIQSLNRLCILSHRTSVDYNEETIIQILSYRLPNEEGKNQRGSTQIVSSQHRVLEGPIIEEEQNFFATSLLNEREQMEIEKVDGYDLIGELYSELESWELLVRLVDKDYRPFMNKKGTETKMMKVTLVDRMGHSIKGTLFGDTSEGICNLLQVGTVYRVSQAQVKEDTYTLQNSKNSDRGGRYSAAPISQSQFSGGHQQFGYSRSSNAGTVFGGGNERFGYSRQADPLPLRSGKDKLLCLNFSSNTRFLPVKDIASIPHQALGETKTVAQLMSMPFTEGLMVDLIGLLVNVAEQKTIQSREGKELLLRKLLVRDSESKQSIEVSIWDSKVEVQKELLGKAVVLRGFRLSRYANKFTLNSGRDSRIKALRNHPMCLNEMPQEVLNKEEDTGSNNLKELELELNRLEPGADIFSNLVLWITRFNFKTKWFYEGCPNNKCKKGVSGGGPCVYCGQQFDRPQLRWRILIECSDGFASLTTTAFQQQGKHIFKNSSIDRFKEMDENDLKEETDKYLYQELKMRIKSHRDPITLDIKHSILSMVSVSDPLRAALYNVDKLRSFLSP